MSLLIDYGVDQTIWSTQTQTQTQPSGERIIFITHRKNNEPSEMTSCRPLPVRKGHHSMDRVGTRHYSLHMLVV